jgi:uncharacterized membrane-anchored protein YitT (DUF2179 family)
MTYRPVAQIASSAQHEDMTATSDLSPAPTTDRVRRHTAVEDVFGILTGTLIAALGLFFLKSSEVVTGGTAGLGLLISYTGIAPFGVVYLLVNLPFFALGLRRKGWTFTLRSALSVLLVSTFSALLPLAIETSRLDPAVAAGLGNLLAGVGILILFRHNSSLGGFGILALLVQENLGWRAGYVQMAMDVTVVLLAFAVVPPLTVLISAGGAVVLNAVLALNHRPGRYTGM